MVNELSKVALPLCLGAAVALSACKKGDEDLPPPPLPVAPGNATRAAPVADSQQLAQPAAPPVVESPQHGPAQADKAAKAAQANNAAPAGNANQALPMAIPSGLPAIPSGLPAIAMPSALPAMPTALPIPPGFAIPGIPAPAASQ